MKSLYACAAVVSIVIACRNNGIQQTGPLTTSQGTDDADSGPVAQISVRGAVQKGPFILGTTVDVSPLDADANPIGLSFSTTGSLGSGAVVQEGVATTVGIHVTHDRDWGEGIGWVNDVFTGSGIGSVGDDFEARGRACTG